MASVNPFFAAGEFLPANFLQIYAVLMFLAVVAGTLYDLWHKRSARFFAAQQQRARARATRPLRSGERALLAAQTLLHEVAASGEFCAWQRRLSHLLMSWGFVLYLLATVALVFLHAGNPQPPLLWPLLWNLGAVMVLVGGLWFFFVLRVDVAREARPPWRLVRADLFIVTLLLSVACALLYEIAILTRHPGAIQATFIVYLFFTTLLFVTVPLSKFAHMFYKPAAALQRRVEQADGSSDLPRPAARE
jgi:hypothetical protein